MALSCCCRLFSRQPKLLSSFQNILQNNHITSKTESYCTVKRWVKDAKSSKFKMFQLNSRGFRSRRIKDVEPHLEVEPHQIPKDSFSLGKSTLFVTAVGTCSFVGAMIWNYENVRKVYKEMGSEKPTHRKFMHEKVLGFRQHMNAIWTGLDSSTKLTFGIIAANIAVWGLWKVPRIQHTMVRYFSSAAAHPRTSMVLSSFSHISFFHLGVNMYVLLSFAPVAMHLFGKEQFSAFYITAGTVSAFASILCQRFLKRPLSVSVGASGAIMGLLGVTGVIYPNAQLQVAFISEIFPHSFSADTGIKAIVLFDLLGLVLGWRVLDHAGHLGGMIFGILYAKYGSKLIWGNREVIVKQWHDLRGKP